MDISACMYVWLQYYAVARQTKTIAFSLSEPNAVQENWILDTPKEEDKLMAGLPSSVVKSKEDVGTSKMSNRQRRRRRRRKSLNEEEDEDDMASWLQQSCVEVSVVHGVIFSWLVCY